MTVEDIMNMTQEEIMGLQTDTLRKYTTILKSGANKRLARLEKQLGANIKNSPAYRNIEGALTIKELRDGRFAHRFASTIRATRQDLLSEMASMRRFMTHKTSMVKGYKSWSKNVREAFGVDPDIPDDELSALITLYNYLVEQSPSLYSRYSLKEIVKHIKKGKENGKDTTEIVKELDEGIEEMYLSDGTRVKVDIKTGEILEEVDLETGEIIYDRFDDEGAVEIPF